MERIGRRVSSLTAALALVVSAAAAGGADRGSIGPRTLHLVRFDTSPPLADLVVARADRKAAEEAREVPNVIPRVAGAADPGEGFRDPLLQEGFRPALSAAPSPPPLLGFEGLSDDDNAAVTGSRVAPPDTQGDVGPQFFVQMVNNVFAVYDKGTGAIASGGGPFSGALLWSGFGGECESSNDGDPVVLYDHLADRWVFSQFALVGFLTIVLDSHECLAVSTTPDPRGPWHRYDFQVQPGAFADYPKLAVWPDGYYLSANVFDLGAYQGAVAAVFERSRMLLGQSAQALSFGPLACEETGCEEEPCECFFSLQPGHLEGPAPPAGTPNPFVMAFDDEVWGEPAEPGAGDSYRLWELAADWEAPETSTFTALPAVATADFDANLCDFDACVPQPPPAHSGDRLETLSQFTMFRAQYRQFSGYSSLAVNHTVDVGGERAGVRWAELRNAGAGWDLEQTGTWAPADGLHRWMGSAAVDGAGNLALGYSTAGAGAGEYPSVAYASRAAADPAGELAGGETLLRAGSDVQTRSGNRWGDYSTMSVDPQDDCTFWYTQEYQAADDRSRSFDFKTWVAAFRRPECGAEATPDGLGFGNVPLGGSSARVVTLSNLGTGGHSGTDGRMIDVSGMTVSDPTHFTLDPSGGPAACGSTTPLLPPAGECTVEVTFEPTVQAFYEATLTVDYEGPGGGSLEVALDGAGFPPCLFNDTEDLESAVPITGTVEVSACKTITAGPYPVGPTGAVSLTAGEQVILEEGVVIEGSLTVTLDPFLAME